MPVKLLSTKQHQEVLGRLVGLARQRTRQIPVHPAGIEYTSLMNCFLLHSVSAAESLLSLASSFGAEWFPAAVSYSIVRPMFEVDVMAHYITAQPIERARQYIEFGSVLTKRKQDACAKHRRSKHASWREGMELEWQNQWESRAREIDQRFANVSSRFTYTDGKRKGRLFENWSGKKIRELAEEVDHLESYDVFYGDLSSFTHGDVHLADRYLKCRGEGPVWSLRADEFDVGNVFRYAATFLTCYMKLFAEQFKTWSANEVDACWDVPNILTPLAPRAP